jgi:hypothetical protein
MAEKKAFILRVNPDMLKEIETWAADEFRSTNGRIPVAAGFESTKENR